MKFLTWQNTKQLIDAQDFINSVKLKSYGIKAIMKYEYKGQVICWTPQNVFTKKDLEQTVELNSEDEVQLLRTLGAINFETWCSLSDEQKTAYKTFENRVEQVYSACLELFTTYHIDLELYALMYRNIPLYHLALDAYSMMFFVSKKDEIIGYGTRIMKDNSEKAQIVKLYYENKVLFPKACKKHVGINLLDSCANDYKFTEDVFRNFHGNHIPVVKCVDALSSDDCKAILNAKQQIINDYENISGKEPWMYDHVQYKGQPDFRHLSLQSILRYKDILSKILFEQGFLSFDKDIETIKKYEEELLDSVWKEVCPLIKKAYTYSVNKIFSAISLKKDEMPEREWYSIECSVEKAIEYLNEAYKYKEPVEQIDGYYSNREVREYENWIYRYENYPQQREDLPLNPGEDLFKYNLSRRRNWRTNTPWVITAQDIQERVDYLKQVDQVYIKNKKKLEQLRESERQQQDMEYNLHKNRHKEIECLQKKLQDEKEKIGVYKNRILQFAESSESIKVIRSNNVALNIYLNRFYEKMYDELWLQKKKFIEELESNFANVDCYISFVREQHKMLRTIEKRKTIDKACIMHYSCKQVFENWYAPIKEEKERLAQIERQQREEIAKQEQEKQRLAYEQKKREEEARQAQFRYNQRNAHTRDKMLSFDKTTHTYTVNGKTLDSVTTLVSNSFPKFNAKEHARHTAARNSMSIQEVIALWEKKGKESRDLGTLLHEKIEKYYQGIDSPDDPAFLLFKQFADKILLKPYRTEWGVYDYDLGIAGSIDFVDYQNGEYSIYDWKRSDKVIANGLPLKINQYGEKGNHPLEHLDNSPYYHYALQLSIYKFILERNYEIKVSHLRLGVFHPSYLKPYLLEMPYLENEVNSIFDLRSEIIF